MIALIDLHEAVVAGAAHRVRVKVGLYLRHSNTEGVGDTVLLAVVLHDFLEVIGEQPTFAYNVVTVFGALCLGFLGRFGFLRYEFPQRDVCSRGGVGRGRRRGGAHEGRFRGLAFAVEGSGSEDDNCRC